MIKRYSRITRPRKKTGTPPTISQSGHSIFLRNIKRKKSRTFYTCPYTAPHDPLHAWPEDIAKYEGVYDVGYEAIRNARFNRQKELGLFGPEVCLPEPSHKVWKSLSTKQKKDQIRRMQVYAAMIDRVDQNIGKLLLKIKELNEEDDTLIMFASDNGSSAENVNTGIGEVGTITRWASLQKDWANVSNTPFRYWKNLSHEGGIRTPFIAYWPKVIKDQGGFNRQPIHFIDVMATVQDVTGAEYPKTFKDLPVTPMQGESFLPALKEGQLPKRKKPIFFEYSSGGAVRDGDWKLVTKNFTKTKGIEKNTNKWEIYDLSKDLTEIKNLAKENPEVVQRLSRHWQDWYDEAYVR